MIQACGARSWAREGNLQRDGPAMQYLHCDRQGPLHERCTGRADILRAKGAGPRTTFNACSMVKPITATAVLCLARAGAVRLDDPLSRHVGDIIRNDRGATIRQTLCHRGGWANPPPLSWVHLGSEHPAFDSRAWRIATLQRFAVGGRAGVRARYSNIGYLLMGELIERVSAMPFESFVEREVFGKIGLRDGECLGFEAPDLASHARGSIVTISAANAVLGCFVDREHLIDGRARRWTQFKPFYVNGAPYGGLIANAGGLTRWLAAWLVDDGPLLDREWADILLGRGAFDQPLGWFRGVHDGEPYLTHAGGGAGYYGEMRLYPQRGRASAVLFNRTGLSDVRALDLLDREPLGDIGSRR